MEFCGTGYVTDDGTGSETGSETGLGISKNGGEQAISQLGVGFYSDSFILLTEKTFLLSPLSVETWRYPSGKLSCSVWCRE